MALGQLGHVGIAKETVFGTAVGATNYLKFNTESLTLSIEDLIEASLNAIRDESTSYEGLGTIAGDTVHEIHPIDVGFLLRSALGQPATTDRTGSFKHIYTPAVHSLPSAQKGTATAGTTTSLTDSGQTWVVDKYIGYWVHITAGTASGNVYYITDNDATSLTFATATAPDNTSVYEIRPGPLNCILPPYTLEVHRDLSGTTPAFQYKGMVANTQAFSVATGAKILTLTNSWLGKDVANLASTTPSLPTTEPFRWHQVLIGIGTAVSSTAMTSATTNTIVKTLAGWTVNAYANYLVRVISGTGIDQTRKIVSNTTDTLTVSPNFTVTPAGTENFEIYYVPNKLESLDWSWDNGLTGIPKLNNTKRIAEIRGDSFRTTTLGATMQVDDITDFSTYFSGWTTRKWVLWFLGANITGNHYYELEIEIPKLLFTAYPIAIGGAPRITVPMTAKMKYDSTLGYAFKVRLYNNTSAY